MSRLIFLVALCVAVFGLVGVGMAEDGLFQQRDSAPAGAPAIAFGGSAAPGMRFGDIGHTSGGEIVGSGCPDCGFGVSGAFCDPEWRGPCVDWKLIGWYSHWGHGFCCEKKCGNAACGYRCDPAPCGCR